MADVIFVHSLNALCPIVATALGIIIDVSPEQPIKAESPIEVTEFGNTKEITGLTYCDTVGYSSTSSVYYKIAADDNTAAVNLAEPGNLGLVPGTKYKVSFYIKPVVMTTKLWTRMNGNTTNSGAGAVYLDDSGALASNATSFLTITKAENGWYKVSTSYNEHQVGWTGMPIILADANGDGIVSILDSTQIQKYIASMIDKLG